MNVQLVEGKSTKVFLKNYPAVPHMETAGGGG
jgi:hypothetical protein